MRLHSGISHPLERVVPEGGAELCDTFIPAGTIVGISSWVVHHDKSVYGQDADDFRPERWLEADKEALKIMERTFFPVSSISFGSRASSSLYGLTMTTKPVWLRIEDLHW
jgi:cytochrome P450